MAQSPDLSLLEAVRSAGYEAAVITTFNAYLPFFETVVLPRLRASGCRHVVLLMDERQLAGALRTPERSPRLAGRFYTLIPVSSTAAFHPKILFLVGKAKGLIHVGSHNLTLGGFGTNREMTAAIGVNSADAVSMRCAAVIWRSIIAWATRGRNGVASEVTSSLSAFRAFAPWLDALPAQADSQDVFVQGAIDGKSGFLEQLDGLLPAKVRKVCVIGAFFDANLTLLQQLRSRYPKCPIYVGIEPSTVQLLGNVSRTRPFDWRDLSRIADRRGYLHAKAIYFESSASEHLLVMGSANPSAPGWGAGAEGMNDECVVTLRASRASATAVTLGMTDLASYPIVASEEIEKAIARSRDEWKLEESEPTSVFVALLEGHEIRIPAGCLKASARKIRGLFGDGTASFDRAVSHRPGQALSIDGLTDSELELRLLEVEFRDGSTAIGILHRRQEILELARTGKQRALQDALEGLRGDTTNLADLISVVDKAIFSDSATDTKRAAAHGSPRSPGGADHPRPESLVVDLEAKKRTKAYARLHLHNQNLAFLLDLLSREMRLEGSKELATDERGRSEEEAPGQDDESGAEAERQRIEDSEIAHLCRGKVKRVINRTIDFLEQASQKQDPASWIDALLKLTAVLVVLRELRQVEQEKRWRLIREQLVPKEERRALLEGIAPALFGRGKSLLQRLVGFLDYGKIEDLSRLKGLILWLEWDSGTRLEDRISALDDPDELAVHLFDKAVLLATAQVIPGDPLALKEAERSIDRCATMHQQRSASDWFQRIKQWTGLVERSVANAKSPAIVHGIRVGGIAYVTTERDATLRVVKNPGDPVVSLVDFGPDSQVIDFERSRVIAVSL